MDLVIDFVFSLFRFSRALFKLPNILLPYSFILFCFDFKKGGEKHKFKANNCKLLYIEELFTNEENRTLTHICTSS